jgi:hypothetical protein
VTYVDPTTVIASATDVSAALWNQDVRDNITAISEWSSYTPTVTQSGAVTMIVNYSKYRWYGGTAEVIVHMTANGSGSSGSAILVSLPVDSAVAALSVGVGLVSDADSGLHYPAQMITNTATQVAFHRMDSATAGIIGVDPAIGLASSDILRFTIRYETV